MVLSRIFEDADKGFYVDVGAHHPKRFSNTYYFYKRGWRGVNIEPNPDVVKLFQSMRKGDVNLQMGVSDSAGKITYHKFNEPALNTFDEEIVKSRLKNTHYKLISTCDVSVDRLDSILARHLPKNTQIDFLTIDVEGLDYSVIKSNDWRAYRPKCVLVEALNSSIEDAIVSDI